MRHADQRDRGPSAVESNDRVAAAHAHVVVGLQVTERVAFEVQLVISRYEVVDDVLATRRAGQELELVRRASPCHRVGTCAADERVGARATHEGVGAAAADHHYLASAGGELGCRRSADEGRATLERELLYLSAAVDELGRAARYRRVPKRSADCRLTGGDHRVAARSKGDLGVASHLNQSGATESDRIPSGARVDGAIAGNANAVVAAADADPALPDRYGVVRISRGDGIGASRLDQTAATQIERVRSGARVDGATAGNANAVVAAAGADLALPDGYGVVQISRGDRIGAGRLDQTSATEIERILSGARIDGAVAAHTDTVFPAADTDSSLADYSYGVVAVSRGDRVVAVRAVHVDALISVSNGNPTANGDVSDCQGPPCLLTQRSSGQTTLLLRCTSGEL